MILAKTTLLKIIITLSNSNNIDPALVAGLVYVESRFDPTATGTIGERGLMRLHPSYFPDPTLYDPRRNLEVGIKSLKDLKRRCSGLSTAPFSWIVCHNRGVSGAKRLKDITNDRYYKEVVKARERYKYILQQTDVMGKTLFTISKGSTPHAANCSYRDTPLQRAARYSLWPVCTRSKYWALYDSSSGSRFFGIPASLRSYRSVSARISPHTVLGSLPRTSKTCSQTADQVWPRTQEARLYLDGKAT